MNMRIANVGKSVGLVGLLLTSLLIGLVTVPAKVQLTRLQPVRSSPQKLGVYTRSPVM